MQKVVNGYNCSITVVNTVGLGNKKQIMDRLVKLNAFRDNQEVHLLIFVIKHNRLTDEEVEAMTNILNCLQKFYFQPAKQITALVVTHCEIIEEDERQREIGSQ